MRRRIASPAHSRWIAPGLAMLLAATVTVAGCGTAGRSAPRTITTVVTQTRPPATGGSGAGITVVAPGGVAGGTESGASGSGASGSGASPAPGQSGATESTTGSTGASGDASSGSTGTTSATPTTSVSISPAAAKALESGCPTMLSASDISAALGSAGAAKVPSDKQLRVVDVAIPTVQMTGRTKCYYGTDDLTQGRPLAVAIANYATADAAGQQMAITAQSEADQGATSSSAEVAGHPAKILLRDGGLLVTQVDTWTLSIAIANGVIPDAQLSAALQKLATTILGHIG